MSLTIIIILIALVFVAMIVIKAKSKQNAGKHSKEFEEYYNSVNQMSYEQLDKMHYDLLPLVKEINDLYQGNLIAELAGATPKYSTQEIEDIKSMILSDDEQIYGCRSRREAMELHEVVMKRLDELDK